MSEQREFIRAQLSSGVDYYKGEKGDKPVKGVDYFTPADIESIVEQIEAGNIDFSAYATKEYVDGAIENIDITETDPTVPAWAKAENKPTYTASEVGALPDDTVLFSGNYNDLSNKPTIPAAYTLPTASTSTLGGVKVDGTTITISDGVISSVGGGSSSAIVFNTAYDADTNKAATMADVDDAVMNAELPASAIAAGMNEQHEPVYLNEVLHNIDISLSGKQDSLVFNTAYNASSNKVATMADIPAAYSLPTATTSTLGGVKVDGSTITIDNNGVISSTASGGSSYTAGEGIAISNNNAISLLGNRTSYLPILYSIMTRNSGMTRQDAFVSYLWANRFSRANIAYHIDNIKTYRTTYFNDGLVVDTWKSLIEGVEGPVSNLDTPVNYRYNATSFADQYTYAMAQTSASLASNSRFNFANQPVFVEYNPEATTKWTFITYPEKLFQNIYFNSQQGLTSHSMAAAIDEVASMANGKITAPTAPSNDGTYFLTSTVSSGVATNSWQSVVIGGSY